MDAQLEAATRSLKHPSKEFTAFIKNDRLVPTLARSLSYHLLSGAAKLRVARRYSFFILQFYYRVFELRLDNLISFSSILDLAAIGNFCYRNSFGSLLNSMRVSGIERHFAALSQMPPDQIETELIKVYFYLDNCKSMIVFVELLKLVCNCSVLSNKYKGIMFNIFDRFLGGNEKIEMKEKYPAFYSKYESIRHGYFAHIQTTIERISVQFPHLQKDFISELLFEHDCIEQRCIDFLSNRPSTQIELQPLVKKAVELTMDLDEFDGEKLKRMTLNALEESSSTDSDVDANQAELEMAGNLDKNQRVLFQYALKSPEILQKDARKLEERRKLLQATNLSHEQVEGWYSMLMRNPKKNKLINDFCTFYKEDTKKL